MGTHTITLVLLGLLPSLVWLWYWSRKDAHPEPKTFIFKVFLLGIILSPIAVVFQLIFAQLIAEIIKIDPQIVSSNPWFYLWAAFIEEVVKWLVVFLIVFRSPEFDEPADAMIYMLTAAMGFAAMENILVVNRVISTGLEATLSILALRFTGATLLHALSSAILGYFIAMSWFMYSHRKMLFWLGLFFATGFHWAFNLFMINFTGSQGLPFATILLVLVAFLISILFDKIKARDKAIRPKVA